MKIAVSLRWIIAFLSLFFLINECHDWVHFLVAGICCHGFGSKGLENWTFCNGCSLSRGWLLLTWLSGPAFNYILMWWAWKWMNREAVEKKAAGLTLFFAAMPLARILAALSGGGDETFAMRLLFGQGSASASHGPAITGLLLVLILTLPPLVKAFFVLPGLAGKALLFPILLYLPMLIDRLVIHQLLVPQLARGTMAREVLPGVPVMVMAWGLLWLVLFLISRRYLSTILRRG